MLQTQDSRVWQSSSESGRDPISRRSLAAVDLRLPAQPSSVPPARRAVTQLAHACGLGDAAVDDIALAVSEALTNGVMHAGGRTLGVRAQADERELHVVVTDDGVGMRPRLDSPGLGLGLTLMGLTCTRVQVEAGPDGVGTAVHMDFALPRSARN